MQARGAQCSASAVPHTAAGLRALLHGAKVVVNVSGPFSSLGRDVVEAALDEGCHYVDTTGEQDFMLDVRRDLGDAYGRAGLVLAPSVAFLWAVGATVSDILLDRQGIDTLEVTYAPPSLQTVASLQSMIRMTRRPGFRLADRRLSLLPPAEVRSALVPGAQARRAVSVGGGEATFFLGDPRVRGCDTLFASETLARLAPLFSIWNALGKVVSGERLDAWSDGLVLKLKKDPPAEEPETARFVVAVVGRGAGQKVRAIVSGTSPYVTTGFLCAMAAQDLLAGKAKRFGYVSLAQTLGAGHVLARLEEIGATMRIEPAQETNGAAATVRPVMGGARA
jgi:hypothetical protein